MPVALAGLALRGHEVYWLGAGASPPGSRGIHGITGMRDLPGLRADVVVGGDTALPRTAACGWLAARTPVGTPSTSVAKDSG